MGLEQTLHIGSLELLHDTRLGIAEGQGEIHGRMRPAGPREKTFQPRQYLAPRYDDGPLDHVLELPPIARPGIPDGSGQALRSAGLAALLGRGPQLRGEWL